METIRFIYSLAANSRRYGKCGNNLLINCLPAQMHVKISNVSTNTQTRICYSVCYAPQLFSEFILKFLLAFKFSPIHSHKLR